MHAFFSSSLELRVSRILAVQIELDLRVINVRTEAAGFIIFLQSLIEGLSRLVLMQPRTELPAVSWPCSSKIEDALAASSVLDAF